MDLTRPQEVPSCLAWFTPQAVLTAVSLMGSRPAVDAADVISGHSRVLGSCRLYPWKLPTRPGPNPYSGFTSAMIGAIMGDACDRLPVVMLINAAIRFFCLALIGPTAASCRIGAGQLKQLAGAAPLSSRGRSHYLRSGGIVLREVRMSQREEQTFKIVAGAVVIGAFAIAAAIAVALV